MQCIKNSFILTKRCPMFWSPAGSTGCLVLFQTFGHGWRPGPELVATSAWPFDLWDIPSGYQCAMHQWYRMQDALQVCIRFNQSPRRSLGKYYAVSCPGPLLDYDVFASGTTVSKCSLFSVFCKDLFEVSDFRGANNALILTYCSIIWKYIPVWNPTY
jgi:hypothetical protein